VNHPICSLAIRAMGVPQNKAITYLHTIQRMKYYLRTGYGLASKGYGGTECSPFMGLTQGSCASPPIWTAISTLILLAYHRDGHGVEMSTAWTSVVKKIAAILYVDDTDLLHTNAAGGDTVSFLSRVQSALTSWSRLLQATGGNLKPEKCYYYILSYRYDRGVARLCTGRELRSYRKLTIPQHSSNECDITLKDPKEATQTLGMLTSPVSDGYAHLAKMLSKCQEWEESIRSSTLPYRDRWHSLYTQLFPSVRYGLIPLMTPPAVLEEAFMDVYYRLLPLLNVNRNITSDWRWLPQTFQGLGLPNMGIEKLSLMLQYVVRHWGSGGPMDFQLRRSFELLQVECGLHGSPFTRDFRLYGCLAMTTWMKLLWQYLDYYQVKLHLDNVVIPPTRERDHVFMELVVDSLPQADWQRINRVRHHKKIYFLSQLLACDGVTVLPSQVGPGIGPASVLVFPNQQPTRSDFALWDSAVRHITSPKLRWSPPLGKF
jgi:hypothetical protein